MIITTHFEAETEDPTVEVGRWRGQDIDMQAAPQEYLHYEGKHYFIQRNGVEFAGTHLSLDLYDASHLDDIERIELDMRDIVTYCGTTLLHIHLHQFSPSGGVSGVADVAESHISVHPGPERNYAAFDVFMCGDAEPKYAVPVLKRAFFPRRIEVCEELRGRVSK